MFLETEDEFYFCGALKAQSHMYDSVRLPRDIVNVHLIFYNMIHILFPAIREH